MFRTWQWRRTLVVICKITNTFWSLLFTQICCTWACWCHWSNVVYGTLSLIVLFSNILIIFTLYNIVIIKCSCISNNPFQSWCIGEKKFYHLLYLDYMEKLCEELSTYWRQIYCRLTVDISMCSYHRISLWAFMFTDASHVVKRNPIQRQHCKSVSDGPM